MTPVLSVVVPVYKTEPYLRQCVDSLLGQTLADIELLLVDDGSPDGCGAICDEYAQKDRRVRVIHKPNGGLVSAWTAGVRAASADYVGFVDSDDWVDPDFYADLYRAVTDAGADVACAELIKEQDPPVCRVLDSPVTWEGPEGIRRLLRQYLLSCLEPDTSKWVISYSRCNKLYRRGLLLDNMRYFQTDISLNEDRLANTAILADCRKVTALSHAGRYHYRVTAGTMSHTFDEASAGALSRFAEAMLAIARDKRLDREPVDVLLGECAYTRIYWAALAHESLGRRSACIRRLCASVPEGALARYAAARGGASIRLFCGLLRAGLVVPCLWLISIHTALSGRKG